MNAKYLGRNVVWILSVCLGSAAALADDEGQGPPIVGFVADVRLNWMDQRSEGKVIVDRAGRIYVEGLPEAHRRWLIEQLRILVGCEPIDAPSKGGWSRWRRSVTVVANDGGDGPRRRPNVIAVQDWNASTGELTAARTIVVGWRMERDFELPRELRVVESKRGAIVNGRAALTGHRALTQGQGLRAGRGL